jgi:hypothetical protein
LIRVKVHYFETNSVVPAGMRCKKEALLFVAFEEQAADMSARDFF